MTSSGTLGQGLSLKKLYLLARLTVWMCPYQAIALRQMQYGGHGHIDGSRVPSRDRHIVYHRASNMHCYVCCLQSICYRTQCSEDLLIQLGCIVFGTGRR